MTTVLLLGILGCRGGASATSPERFDTPDWDTSGGIELRADAGAGLLLRHRTTQAVYRYEAGTARLAGVGADAWERAGGEIVDCDLAAARPTRPFVLDPRSGGLSWNGGAVPLAGSTALWIGADPSGDRVAVLSAAGQARGSVAPALGRGGSAGRHYHQVLKRNDGAEQGQAVALPVTSERVALAGCWSADGRYVVYADVLYSHLCVVEVVDAGGDAR